MNSKILIRKALSTCLAIAITATYSAVTLASSEKIAGELLINGTAINGQIPVVKVNGETAQSGRSIFTASTIATPDNAAAILSLGKAGKIEIAPNSALTLSFDANGISGNLTAGRVVVIDASNSVNIKTLDGNVLKLGAGESASASGGQAQTNNDDDDNGRGFLIFAIVLGGAAAGIILAATNDNNRIALGGGTTVVSTIR